MSKQPEPWSDLRARDVMRTNVVTVAASAPLSDLVETLAEHRISGVPVTDEVGHLVGVVSFRDVLEHLAVHPEQRRVFQPRRYYLASADEDLAPEEFTDVEVPENEESTVADVMTAEVHSIGRDTPLREVAERLLDLKVHRLLVLDKQKHVGLISATDVLAGLLGRKT